MAVAIKICGITDPETARQAVRLGADLVGLVLAPSPRRLSLEAAARLITASGLPAERFVAVLRSPTAAEWELVRKRLPGVHLQLHGREDDPAPGPDWVGQAHRAGVLAIAGVNGEQRPPGWQDADILLWDGAQPGSGRHWQWRPPDWRRPAQPWWLAGGLTPENVAQALAATHPDGVDVSSGVEQGGRKQVERIARFIEEVRAWQG